MWKWLQKTKSIKGDLLNFKDEPLSGLSIVLLIVLDVFIFTNVMMGVEAERAKAPTVYHYYPSDCKSHFENVKTSYDGFEYYRYGQSRSLHKRPHLSQTCQDLDANIEVFSLKKEFKDNLKLTHQIKDKLSQNDRRLTQISKDYNTRLFERIAQMQNNSELKNAKNEYDSIVFDNKNLKEELKLIKLVSTLNGYTAYVDFIKTHKLSFKEEKKSYAFWQPFKSYSYMIMFILPLLLFFGFFYARAKRQQLLQKDYNPVVKIITAHISLILALPLFFYTLGLIYHVLPKTLLKSLIEFLVEIGFMSLLNYFAILLVVLVFGFLIYWVQKRNLAKRQSVKPSKNLARAVSKSICFVCDYKIDYTKPYCPFCGEGLHKKCSSCDAIMNKHERFCASCAQKNKD